MWVGVGHCQSQANIKPMPLQLLSQADTKCLNITFFHLNQNTAAMPKAESKTKTSKPTKEKFTTEAYGVITLQASHKEIRKLKKSADAPSIHGTKLWGSSYMLMDYLQKNPPSKKEKILELGCGWGVAGIHCAKHYKANVTGVDADPAVFPYLRLFAEYNNVSIEEKVAYFEKLSAKYLGSFDTIIAADICFWDELGETVYKLIKRAIKGGTKRIIMADPGRPPFTDMAEKCVEKYYAEFLDYDVSKPKKATGYLLVIENA